MTQANINDFLSAEYCDGYKQAINDIINYFKHEFQGDSIRRGELITALNVVKGRVGKE